MPDRTAIDELLDWMINGARPSANAADIIDGICTRLVKAGVPVTRFVLFIYTLHPNIRGKRFKWIEGEKVDAAEADIGVFSTELYRHNPLPHVIERQRSVRRKLVDPQCPDDYLIVGELREQGMTDYLAQPLVFITGETNVATWSTNVPDGFSDEMIDILEKVGPPLARLTETYMMRLNASYLLSTYVGRNVGDKILNGAVDRGSGEEINAVILFVDLKEFTKRSNNLAGATLISALNTALDALVPPVENNGGEILKYLGDGFFAIFPFELETDAPEAIASAFLAVQQGLDALEKSNAEQAIEMRFDIRSAIHSGSFHYGNIGGSARLDFTAIGPAVNYSARLLSSATDLGVDHVVSDYVAGLMSKSLMSKSLMSKSLNEVGTAEFKGFTGKQRIFEIGRASCRERV